MAQLPEHVAMITGRGELDGMRRRLLVLSMPRRIGLRRNDYLAAAGIFLLVVAATFPVVVPFLMTDDVALAMRFSRAVTLAMLFVLGFVLGRHAGHGLEKPQVRPALLLGALVFGGVERRTEGVGAIALPEPANADFDRKRRADAPPMRRLEGDDPSGVEALPVALLEGVIAVQPGIEQRRRAADDVLGRVAEALAGLAVHVDDGAVVVLDEQRIDRMTSRHASWMESQMSSPGWTACPRAAARRGR